MHSEKVKHTHMYEHTCDKEWTLSRVVKENTFFIFKNKNQDYEF